MATLLPPFEETIEYAAGDVVPECPEGGVYGSVRSRPSAPISPPTAFRAGIDADGPNRSDLTCGRNDGPPVDPFLDNGEYSELISKIFEEEVLGVFVAEASAMSAPPSGRRVGESVRTSVSRPVAKASADSPAGSSTNAARSGSCAPRRLDDAGAEDGAAVAATLSVFPIRPHFN